MTSGLRAIPHRLNIKLFTGKVQAWGDGRTQTSRGLLLLIRTDLAPSESQTADVGEAELGSGSLKLHRFVTQLESWHSVL